MTNNPGWTLTDKQKKKIDERNRVVFKAILTNPYSGKLKKFLYENNMKFPVFLKMVIDDI